MFSTAASESQLFKAWVDQQRISSCLSSMFPFCRVSLWRVKAAWTKWPRKGLLHTRKLPSKASLLWGNKPAPWLLTITILKQFLLLKQSLMRKVRLLNHVRAEWDTRRQILHFPRTAAGPSESTFPIPGVCSPAQHKAGPICHWKGSYWIQAQTKIDRFCLLERKKGNKKGAGTAAEESKIFGFSDTCTTAVLLKPREAGILRNMQKCMFFHIPLRSVCGTGHVNAPKPMTVMCRVAMSKNSVFTEEYDCCLIIMS